MRSAHACRLLLVAGLLGLRAPRGLVYPAPGQGGDPPSLIGLTRPLIALWRGHGRRVVLL